MSELSNSVRENAQNNAAGRPWTQPCEHPDNALVPDGQGWIHCGECRTCLSREALDGMQEEMAEAILAWVDNETSATDDEWDARVQDVTKALHDMAERLRAIGASDA